VVGTSAVTPTAGITATTIQLCKWIFTRTTINPMVLKIAEID
jgi:hypothetical protein